MTDSKSEVRIRTSETDREQMDIVVIGHVDHGKSTLVGRLLADTGSLPEGKLEQVKQRAIATRSPLSTLFCSMRSRTNRPRALPSIPHDASFTRPDASTSSSTRRGTLSFSRI